MKDKKWAKKEIKKIRALMFDAYEAAVIANNKHFQLKNSEQLALINKILEILNQLDEPEVLSEEWIEENKKDSGVHYIGYYVPIGRLHDLLVPKRGEVLSQEWIDEHSDGPSRCQYVWVDYLKELLVPKQEITKVPQEWFDVIKRNKDMTLETILRIASPKREEEERFVKAWLAYPDIEVEDEQKYHVADGNDTLLCRSNGVVMTVGKLWAIGNEREAEYDLTEQEIKDYDERYWSFAVPVEVAE